ncbi:MAG: GIY-YIG nuclease family protein [Lachnospiraceae bacterium]|nr:GIY-YIG nuclease family protein [Lachnospiraceae bacterium]
MQAKEEKNKNKAYVYVLRCKDQSLYTGITTDLARRLSEHLAKEGQGAKYTRSHPVTGIEAAFEVEDLRIAAKYEYRLKRLSKSQKEELVRDPKCIRGMLSELFQQAPAKPLSGKKLSEFRIVFSNEK